MPLAATGRSRPLGRATTDLGVPLGLLLSITLFVLFGYRYAVKTKKFMPSGLLAIASLIVLAVMFLVMDWSGMPDHRPLQRLQSRRSRRLSGRRSARLVRVFSIGSMTSAAT